jgi:hypothetical protein
MNDLPLPSLPLGPRIVFLCLMLFAIFMGVAGALHEGDGPLRQGKPSYRLPISTDSYDPLNPRPGDGMRRAIRLAEESTPKVSIGSSINGFFGRLGASVKAAALGLVFAALYGLGIGAAIGLLWWLIFAVAARVQRRPMEMVFDDWREYFHLQLALGVILTALIVLFGGLATWPYAVPISSGLGLLLAGLLRLLPDNNEQRQKAILGTKT